MRLTLPPSPPPLSLSLPLSPSLSLSLPRSLSPSLSLPYSLSPSLSLPLSLSPSLSLPLSLSPSISSLTCVSAFYQSILSCGLFSVAMEKIAYKLFDQFMQQMQAKVCTHIPILPYFLTAIHTCIPDLVIPIPPDCYTGNCTGTGVSGTTSGVQVQPHPRKNQTVGGQVPQ